MRLTSASEAMRHAAASEDRTLSLEDMHEWPLERRSFGHNEVGQELPFGKGMPLADLMGVTGYLIAVEGLL